ncbi:tail fiber assembly protein [Vibrio fluvialis]|uniref:tail fiber assembly protein n=1 Tax=Vibrio fluvialis TaxID=676 RepID=UPI001F3094CD|nr:hypothetical protein [Vibrio fluvialis]MCE7580831.1 hypothetical protein [Vibrio fluvialis]
MKYWMFDPISKLILGSGYSSKWNIPRNVLLEEPLPAKEGFAVVATADFKNSEYVADFRGKTIYSKFNPLQSKQVEQLGEIEDSWTLKKPETSFDVWNEALDNWQTDLQAQYEAEVQQVTNIRESLYTQIVDRLNNEAKMIRRVEGNEAKAAEYEAQADAAYLKIRADNPWPIAPITE